MKATCKHQLTDAHDVMGWCCAPLKCGINTYSGIHDNYDITVTLLTLHLTVLMNIRQGLHSSGRKFYCL